MIIARKNEDDTFTVAHYQDLFPHVSFSTNGPNDEWFEQNECYRVSLTRDYDSETEELVSCDPYLENGIVYTVVAQASSKESLNSSSNTA